MKKWEVEVYEPNADYPDRFPLNSSELIDIERLLMQLSGCSSLPHSVGDAHLQMRLWGDNVYLFFVRDLGLGKDIHIIGMASLMIQPTWLLNIGVVNDIVVGENHLGQGIEEALMDAVIREAKTMKKLLLDVLIRTCHSNRKTEISLYQELGFKKDETNVFRLNL